MARTLNEIQWDQPIVPASVDAQWDEEVKKKTGSVQDILRRASPSPWLRQLLLEVSVPRLVHITGHRATMMNMVAAQENACRYCYGANRATMRVLGYSEKRIGEIERNVQLADFDEKDRAMLHFTRALARSNPRPGRADLEQLLSVGFSQQAIVEAAYFVSIGCMFNRVATFMAVPPIFAYERFANGIFGRLLAPFMAKKLSIKPSDPAREPAPDGQYGKLTAALSGLPAAHVVRNALEGAFASDVLSARLKVLMFGVVARALQCAFCETECRKLMSSVPQGAEDFDRSLGTLDDASLDPEEQIIFKWTRNTVHYETENVQRATRAMSTQIGIDPLIEAIGVAALANGIVRLAAILE